LRWYAYGVFEGEFHCVLPPDSRQIVGWNSLRMDAVLSELQNPIFRWCFLFSQLKPLFTTLVSLR
jgi:hypothetical protein